MTEQRPKDQATNMSDSSSIDFTACTSEQLGCILREGSVDDWNKNIAAARSKNTHWSPLISGGDFQRLDLRGIDLRRTLIPKADFGGSDLGGADFRLADLSDAIFDRTNLSRSNMSQAGFNRASFFGAIMASANIKQAKLEGANFSYAQLTHAFLDQTDLVSVNFQRANLYRAKLFQANLEKGNMLNANLSEADFRGALLSDMNLEGANLNNANLSQAKVNDSPFFRVNVEGANFEGATISNSFFVNTDICSANLQGVKLRPTDNNQEVQVSKYRSVGSIGNSPVLLFAIDEEPGFIINYTSWVGSSISELVDHVKRLYGDQWVIQVESMAQPISDTISEWQGVKSHDPLAPPSITSPASYLAAEAERTGQSPADIILGE